MDGQARTTAVEAVAKTWKGSGNIGNMINHSCCSHKIAIIIWDIVVIVKIIKFASLQNLLMMGKKVNNLHKHSVRYQILISATWSCARLLLPLNGTVALLRPNTVGVIHSRQELGKNIFYIFQKTFSKPEPQRNCNYKQCQSSLWSTASSRRGPWTIFIEYNHQHHKQIFVMKSTTKSSKRPGILLLISSKIQSIKQDCKYKGCPRWVSILIKEMT